MINISVTIQQPTHHHDAIPSIIQERFHSTQTLLHPGVQFIYGNSQIVYGYPAWYIWGICTLPLISALIAVWVLIVNSARLITGERKTRATGKVLFAIITLLHTVYLFYWNFLPIHYS